MSCQPGETQVLARAGLESLELPSLVPLGFLADLQGPSSIVTEQSRLCADVHELSNTHGCYRRHSWQ